MSTTPEISVIMPSVRPHIVGETIQEFADNNPDVDYELLIASPFPMSGPRVIHIPETKPEGTVIAANKSYAIARGEYIANWADDFSPSKDCLKNLLAFVKKYKEPFYANCRFKARRGLLAAQYQAYGKMFPIWGCMSRKTIEMVGGFNDPAFLMHLCDIDLGLRIWEKGGSVRVCPDAFALGKNFSDEKGQSNKDEVNRSNWEKYWEADAETFLKKWHHKFKDIYEMDLGKIIGPVPLGFKDDFIFSLYTKFVPSRVKQLLKDWDNRKIIKLFGGGTYS